MKKHKIVIVCLLLTVVAIAQPASEIINLGNVDMWDDQSLIATIAGHDPDLDDKLTLDLVPELSQMPYSTVVAITKVPICAEPNTPYPVTVACWQLSWRPGGPGEYGLVFVLSDGTLSAYGRVNVSVRHRNRPPVLQPLADVLIN